MDECSSHNPLSRWLKVDMAVSVSGLSALPIGKIILGRVSHHRRRIDKPGRCQDERGLHYIAGK
jgi:hypothetical protein